MKKEMYLSEDQDILDDLETNLKGIGDREPLPKEMMKINISALQIKSTLRTRKTMIDLDKSNTNFTKVIIFFTFVQICIAVSQFLLEVVGFPNKIFSIFVAVVFITGILILNRNMTKWFKAEESTKN